MYSELEDATGLLAEGRTALLESLRADGYLFFRGLLDRDRVRAVRRQVGRVLVENGWVKEQPDGGLRALSAPYHPGDASYWPAYTAIQRLEDCHSLAYEPALLDTIRLLVGPDIVVHPRKMVRVAFPADQDPLSTTVAHQDFPYVQGGVDGITAWVSLGDTPRKLGGLAVLRSSAGRGIRPIHGEGHYRCAATELDDLDGDWLSTDYYAGDVLMFHSLTVHGAVANRTDQVRVSVDFRYRALTEPILDDETLPPYHPNVPGWPELSAGWRSLRWISLPPHTRIVPLIEPTGGVPVPPSELMGTPAGMLVTTAANAGRT